MSKANTWEDGLLALLLTNAAFAGVGDAGGLLPSSTAGSLYISLHSSSPGEGGDQTTNEVAFTSYARVAVARAGGSWDLTSGQGANHSTITFPTCTGGSATATHFGIGTSSSGAGKLLYSGALNNTVAIGLGNPVASFAAGALVVTED